MKLHVVEVVHICTGHLQFDAGGQQNISKTDIKCCKESIPCYQMPSNLANRSAYIYCIPESSTTPTHAFGGFPISGAPEPPLLP